MTDKNEVLRSLYEITGNITDHNTVLVNIAELETLRTGYETALLYEELRAAIDGGHESMTHADALAKIAEMTAENETLSMGYAAARLEIESLRAAQPAEAQQPGTAYAALMQAASDWICEHVPTGTRGSTVWATKLQDAAHALRASHGQAPAQAAPAAVAGPSDPSITLDFKQATELLKMFGGEPGRVTLQHGNERSHSGAGLYAWYSDLPEEGAEFLGAEPDDEVAPTTQPAPQPVEREPLPSVEIMRIILEVEQQHNFLRGTTNWSAAVGRAVERAHGIKGGQHGAE